MKNMYTCKIRHSLNLSSIFILAIVLASCVSGFIEVETTGWEPYSPVLAQSTGMSNLMYLPSNFIQMNGDPYKCSDVFDTYFSHIEPLSHGYYGAVFLAYSREDPSKRYALKATRIAKRSCLSQYLDAFAGVKILDEVKIGYSLGQKVSRLLKSGAFVRTLDWFQCNYRNILERFCRSTDNQACPSLSGLPKDTNDMQFMLMEYSHSVDILSYMTGLDSDTIGPRLTSLIRSITFQSLHAMSAASNASEFFHFDLNIHNIRLEDNSVALRLIESHLGNQTHFTFPKNNDGQEPWRVPIQDSDGKLVRIIDFGIARIRADDPEINDDETVTGRRAKTIVGAKLAKLLPDKRQNMQVCMRQLFLNILIAMPRQMIRKWQLSDPDGYGQFECVATKAIGFNTILMGKLLMLRPSFKDKRPNFHEFGYRSILKKCGEAAKIRYAKMVGGYSVNSHNILEHFREKYGFRPIDKSNYQTYEHVMNMPFYRVYNEQQLSESATSFETVQQQ